MVLNIAKILLLVSFNWKETRLIEMASENIAVINYRDHVIRIR